MTVVMMLSLTLTAICFWVSAAGIAANLVGRLFYSRFKPIKGYWFWFKFTLIPLMIFLFSAYMSKAHLGDGVWL